MGSRPRLFSPSCHTARRARRHAGLTPISTRSTQRDLSGHPPAALFTRTDAIVNLPASVVSSVMAFSSGKCPIWGTDFEIADLGYDSIVNSKRAGGRYRLIIDTKMLLDSDVYGLKDDRAKAILTTWILNQQGSTDAPSVSREIIDRVNKGELKPMYPISRAERFLRFLANSWPPGSTIVEGPSTSQDDLLAYTESVTNRDVILLVDWLDSKGFLKRGGGSSIRLTLDGYQRLAELDSPNSESRQVFVAMWFDDDTASLRETLREAVELAGLTPYIIDEDPSFENKICDKIEVEIRRSRLLIADFTYGCGGARGSVYYEAGLAKGLGVPVVWTCRESQIEDLHFDTNHYPHLGWEDEKLEEFRKRVADRLRLLVAS